MNRRTIICIALIFYAVVSGCSKNSPVATDGSISMLRILSAPERVTLDGQELSLGYGYHNGPIGAPIVVIAGFSAIQDLPEMHQWVEAEQMWVLVGGLLLTSDELGSGPTSSFEHDSRAFRIVDHRYETAVAYRPGTRIVLAIGVRDEDGELVLVRSREFYLMEPFDEPFRPNSPLLPTARGNILEE